MNNVEKEIKGDQIVDVILMIETVSLKRRKYG